MSVFKCKMCGGTLEINSNESVAVCQYCGTKQTLPKLDDEKRVMLYDRANHFRRENEFDKAMGIYELILAEDREDSEAYWGIVLCKYGIEYVEDPRTHKRIPTVNRAQYTSVFDDKDYQSAIQFADSYQREIYEAEAKQIDLIQKGILEISSKEEPFDVFICYKETDDSGSRTPDSVYAQDIYQALTKEGYKVFFSRITLESKLGQQYEPYIFAALNSAKVMIVVGTSRDNFNAVWVRNEWSRFLTLTKEDKSKVIIPCYKDISPYDMPEEFSYLQSQDMSKIGFLQDILYGINKIIKKQPAKETVVIEGANANAAPLLKRAAMFREEKDWENADKCCERILDMDPENAEAYVGKLLAELKVEKLENLNELDEPFDASNNYQKAYKFGDDKLKKTLVDALSAIVINKENARLNSEYNYALKQMNAAKSHEAFDATAVLFEKLKGFNDADALAGQCRKKADELRKDSIYDSAVGLMQSAKIPVIQQAMAKFQSISGWRDSNEKINECTAKIDEINKKKAERALEEKKRNRRLVIYFIIAIVFIVAIIVSAFVVSKVIIPNQKYNEAMALYEAGEYEKARYAFAELEGYKDSGEKIKEIADIQSEQLSTILKTVNVNDVITFGAYEQDNNTSNGKEPIEWIVLEKSDDRVMVLSINELDCDSNNIYSTEDLMKWLNEQFVFNALNENERKLIIGSVGYGVDNESGIITDYTKIKPCVYLSTVMDNYSVAEITTSTKVNEKLNVAVGNTITFGSYEQDNNTSNGKEAIEWIVLDKKDDKILVISKYVLEESNFNDNDTTTTWENSTLRAWLNGTFMASAFTKEEQGAICDTVVKADANPEYDTSPGNDTTDKMFLLSLTEVNKYFKTATERQCKGTASLYAQGVYNDNGICRWWLRTPGLNSYFALAVTEFDYIDGRGSNCYGDFNGVRPAMWIDISK